MFTTALVRQLTRVGATGKSLGDEDGDHEYKANMGGSLRHLSMLFHGKAMTMNSDEVSECSE